MRGFDRGGQNGIGRFAKLSTIAVNVTIEGTGYNVVIIEGERIGR